MAAFCGDGNQDSNEDCDDGAVNNTGAYGACNSDCTRAGYCGDGLTQTEEECDNDGTWLGGRGDLRAE